MQLSTPDKIRALRELTVGAPDVYACYARGDSADDDHWRPVYSQLSDTILLLHLQGRLEIGSYPLIPAARWPTCRWICADFDGKRPMTDWKADVQRLVPFLLDFDGCPVFVNLSRSAQGAHVRMLFREPVPAWMARRWLHAWLREADVVADDEWDSEIPSSFDRLIPPQDALKRGTRKDGRRYPGNLAGSPLHGGHARRRKGTLPLDPRQVALGNFEPDGRHWEHVMRALEGRGWGETELRQALGDAPEVRGTEAPSGHGGSDFYGAPRRALPVLPGSPNSLQMMSAWCAFVEHLTRGGRQDYHLWMAMASQLHRFGDDGKALFHEISACDPRYNPSETERKWQDTADMQPVRCDTLVRLGWTCPHLGTRRCKPARSPAYFGDYTYAEVL